MHSLSKKYATTRTFKINKSPLLKNWLAVIHIIAIVVAFFNALTLTYRLIIIFSIVISFIFYLKRLKNVYWIRYSSLSGWELSYAENVYFPIEILPSTVLTTYLIVLHFKQLNKQKQTILIFKDSLIGDDYRKLKVELKISGLGGSL